MQPIHDEFPAGHILDFVAQDRGGTSVDGVDPGEEREPVALLAPEDLGERSEIVRSSML